MANNLDPELLKRIQAYYAPSASGWSMADLTPYYEGGVGYQQNGSAGNAQSGAGAYAPTSYLSYDEGAGAPGEKYQEYDLGGKWTREGEFKDVKFGPELALFALATGGMMALPGGPLSGLFGTGGAAGAGAGADTLGMAGLYPEGMTAAEYASLGGLPGAATAGGGGGGLLGSLGKLGGSNLLGLASTALGGLAGSEGGAGGGGGTTTAERKMDPRLDPYIYGNGDQRGLLQYAQSLLDQQMAPGYLKGYDDMRSIGQGLLARPIAGNGFSLFSSRK